MSQGIRRLSQRARDLLDQALALFREQGDLEPPMLLRFEGQLACQQGEWGIAQRAYRASLRAYQAMGVKWEVAACLEGLGRVAAGRGEDGKAARMWGAAAELRAQLGAPLPPVDDAWYEASVARVRAMLGEVDAACFGVARLYECLYERLVQLLRLLRSFGVEVD